MDVINIIIAILTGLSTCIPLVIQLIKYIKVAMKEKNWSQLLGVITRLMIEAETKFDDGKDRKEWVMTSIKAMSNTINYDIDYDAIDEMIDALRAMTNMINITKQENTNCIN
ncbi:MAG: hypothetical protein KBT27_15230 [Prevotellaceae bacterium]|nr:hypothetical protein [Candidatus Faecinaster equi]